MPLTPSLGFILATLKLDRQSRTYCGPNDIITGSVVLQWQPPEKGPALEELFGPLQVDVQLEGLLEIQAAENREEASTRRRDASVSYRRHEERLLCRRTTSLWDGPIRIASHASLQYDFIMQIPENPEEDVSGYGLLEPLPSSFNTEVSIQKGEGKAEAAYRVIALASMPGIDIRVVSRGDTREICYKAPLYPPNLPIGTNEHVEELAVRSKYLLPEVERPRGLKAMFAKPEEIPRLDFKVVVGSFPKSLALDQHLVFQVWIVPDWESSAAKIVPEATVKKCQIVLRTNTEIRTRDAGEQRGFSTSPALVATQLSPRIAPRGLLIEDGESVTQTVTAPLPNGIGSTILLENVKRSYEVQIDLEFVVAKEVVGKSLRGLKLAIHSGDEGLPSDDQLPPPQYDGPSSQDLGPADDLPPQYDAKKRIDGR